MITRSIIAIRSTDGLVLERGELRPKPGAGVDDVRAEAKRICRTVTNEYGINVMLFYREHALYPEDEDNGKPKLVYMYGRCGTEEVERFFTYPRVL